VSSIENKNQQTDQFPAALLSSFRPASWSSGHYIDCRSELPGYIPGSTKWISPSGNIAMVSVEADISLCDLSVTLRNVTVPSCVQTDV
jgi:hypothetical protein